MKTGLLFLSSFALVASAANATGIIASATGLVSPVTTITFSEVSLAQNTQVTNQFAAYGVTFPQAASYSPQTGFPNIVGDTLGNFGSDNSNVFFTPFTVGFTSVQNAAAFAMVSNGTPYFFEALLGNSVVDSFSYGTVDTSANNFFGFTGVSFDSIRVTNQSSDYWLIDNVQLSSVGGVPEPASWALMIAGFGMVGAAARSRRRTTVAA